MYKIYINEKLLHLVDLEEAKSRFPGTEENPVLPYLGKKSQLKKAKKWLEQNDFASITFYNPKPSKILKDFIKIVFPFYAGGGLVRNAKNQYFFIFRRGHWDLPKGKIDPGETVAEACEREVFEETGIKATITQELVTTYHTYIYKQQPALKITTWYLMDTQSDEFVLQTEEDIDKGKWIDLQGALRDLQPMYINIQEVIREAMKLKTAARAVGE